MCNRTRISDSYQSNLWPSYLMIYLMAVCLYAYLNPLVYLVYHIAGLSYLLTLFIFWTQPIASLLCQFLAHFGDYGNF